MRWKSRSLMVGGALALLAGTAHADVRVIHASPDAPNVDVYVNQMIGTDTPAIENLGFTEGTPYIDLPSDDYNFQVTPFGETSPVVIDTNATIDDSLDYSVVASGFLSGISPNVYVDDNTIDPNNARVRFIHQSPDAPAVDIFANNSINLFDAVSFGESGGYQTVAPGDYDIDVRLDSNGMTVLDDLDLSFEAGSVYTVFAMGSAEAGTLDAVVFTDAVIPAPGAAGLLGAAVLFGRRRRRSR